MKKNAFPTARLFLWTGLFVLALLGLMEGLCYFLLPDRPPARLSGYVPPGLYKEVVMSAVAGVTVIWALLMWLVIRRICRKAVDKVMAVEPDNAGDKEAAALQRETALHRDKKLFLHLISVMQNDGRLLDFLNEDLDRFEDNQIGAAVRGVHDQCKKALAKYVTLEPLSDREEGERVRVAQGFDPGVYRLSGNVTGDPPFEGNLVHKGWRAGRLNIPGFSFSGDPEIIAPMEVKVE